MANRTFAALVQSYDHPDMADELDRVRRLVWDEARKRRYTMMQGDPPYPNCNALADAIGADEATVWRLVWGKRHTKELRDGIAQWLALSASDLEEALRNAPPLPDHPKLRPKVRKTPRRPS